MNFIKKLKKIVDRNTFYHQTNLNFNERIVRQNEELIWANVFHDSIKKEESLKELSLNIGRWAGNYSFFYVLYRILVYSRPNRILEFGLGESSKFISTLLEEYLPDCEHLIIEHDEEWKRQFIDRFNLRSNSIIEVYTLEEIMFHGELVKSYKGLEKNITKNFDFYLVDGPHGSKNISRIDILELVKKFSQNHEFIILFDDIDRKGEQQTVRRLLEILNQSGINFYTGTYSGLKSQIVIGSEKYKFVENL